MSQPWLHLPPEHLWPLNISLAPALFDIQLCFSITHKRSTLLFPWGLCILCRIHFLFPPPNCDVLFFHVPLLGCHSPAVAAPAHWPPCGSSDTQSPPLPQGHCTRSPLALHCSPQIPRSFQPCSLGLDSYPGVRSLLAPLYIIPQSHSTSYPFQGSFRARTIAWV